MTAWQEAQVVIAVNDDTVPVGLFIPSVVAERLPQTSQILHASSPQLQQTVGRPTEIGDLARAIAAIEGEHDEFHSEYLNHLAPDPYICEDHGKPHKLSRCPCDIHPGAPCGRRKVAGA